MRERAIEARLKLLAKLAGGVAYKLDARASKGAPDRVVVLPGRPPVFVELKSETGRLSPMQRIEHARIRAAGGEVRVLRGMREVEAFFDA